ncbi:MAG: hypothetical protein KAW47_04190 [Thermoplasmatales archaeon]|nr:hypothetical protein [Thermoplasmatales archaeon]
MESDIIIGCSIGVFSAVVSGFALIWFKKYWDEKSTKKSILRSLLSEIELNQSRLKNDAEAGAGFRKFSENRKVNESVDEETRIVLEKAITKNGYNIDRSSKVCFDRTIYSNASRELGLLNPEIRNKIISYYGGLHLMEYILEILYEISASPEINRCPLPVKISIKKTRTKEYYDKAEECFNLGTELIKDLNTPKK